MIEHFSPLYHVPNSNEEQQLRVCFFIRYNQEKACPTLPSDTPYLDMGCLGM